MRFSESEKIYLTRIAADLTAMRTGHGPRRQELRQLLAAVDPALEDELAVQGRYADLLIVGQSDPQRQPQQTPRDLLEMLALSTGRCPKSGAASMEPRAAKCVSLR